RRLDLDATTVLFGDRLPPRPRRLLEGRFPLLVRVPVPGDVEVGDVGNPHSGQSLPTAASRRTRQSVTEYDRSDDVGAPVPPGLFEERLRRLDRGGVH